jgi:hypothetical protein
MTINQARGYLYEILIAHLLEKNNFSRCQKGNSTNRVYKCGVTSEAGEVLGRGTQHQIDFVGIYTKNIPFIYPIRLLAECKFWTSSENDNSVYKPVSKSFIREYIGVYKDISENYFVSRTKKPVRFLDVPIIFSAGGFNTEAQNLALAHGINIVSHSKIPIMSDILDFINSLVFILPEQYFTDKRRFKKLKEIVFELIRGNISFEYENKIRHLTSSLNQNIITPLVEILERIRNIRYNTFLFATTEHGKLINLIGYSEFPNELFSNQDSQDCGVFFDDNENIENNDENDRLFYITLNEDTEQKKFYFQASDEMMREGFSNRSRDERINTKEQYFKKLSIMKEIDGLTRLITINVNFERIMDRVR